MAHHIVVGEGETHPPIRGSSLRRINGLAEMVRRELAAEIVEGVRHVEPLAARRIGAHHLELVLAVADLPDRRLGPVLIEQRTDALHEGGIFGLALVVDVFLEIVGVHRRRRRGIEVLGLNHRIVLEPQRMKVKVHRVEPEAVDPTLQPEAHVVELSFLHVRTVEVEVRLRGEKIVHVVLHAPAVPGPRATAEDRKPVVGRGAIGLGVRPHEPVGLVVGAIDPALRKPGMPIRTVRDHLVDDHLEFQRVGLIDQPVEIADRPEDRIDVAIVRHVVAEILHR